jgi:ribosomal protein S18 acetylase RimI-like enzyme
VIREATSDDLDAISRLTATRHARSLAGEPNLGHAYEDPAQVRIALPTEPHGWVTERDGAVTAAWLWENKSGWAYGRLPCVVGDQWDLANMYGTAAQHWVDDGITTHAVVTPSVDRAFASRLIDLGFGRQQVYAVRPLTDGGGRAPKEAANFNIETAGPERIDDIVALGDKVARHHERAPVFDVRSNSFYTGLAETYLEAMEAGTQCWVAYDHKTPVGLLLWRPGVPTPFYDPKGAEIELLGVDPDQQGRRIGPALCQSALATMARYGHSSVTLDWRGTNLEAARFWLSLGFLPVAHRYVREVNLNPYWD